MRAPKALRLALKLSPAGILYFSGCIVSLRAQQSTVTARIELTKRIAGNTEGANTLADAANVVVWLSPLGHAAAVAGETNSGDRPQLLQRNKTFEPHVLVIPVGSLVEFPNKDPFLHNVFSLFNGKRFDLGFYEAGQSKAVRFDRPGVSFLFCNIHAEMTAVVVAVDTPYYALSDHAGGIAIPDVPDGRYQMHVWYERGLTEDLKSLDRIVQVSSSTRSFGVIRVIVNSDYTLVHKNKYGQNYNSPPNAGYSGP
jgi:plastocyanin